MMSPESVPKFSHHLTRETVASRASTGLFLSVCTPSLPMSVCNMWLMEHFSLVTPCTKFSKGNRTNSGNSQVGIWHGCWQAETEQRHGSYKPNEKQYCIPQSDSSYTQELIIVTLTVAMCSLLSFRSIEQYPLWQIHGWLMENRSTCAPSVQ